MRILFCVEFYHPAVGGAQEVVRQIAERMAGSGHDVTVATTRLTTRDSEWHNGVRIREFEVAGNLVRGLDGDVAGYRRFLQDEAVDVIFFYAAQQWTFDAAWPVLDLLTAARVLVPCGYSALFDPAFAGYFRELPGVLASMDAVVYHATDYRDLEFARARGLQNDIVIPNGADGEEFAVEKDPGFRRSLGIDDGAVVVLTVGSLNGAKGHLELAQAFARVDLKGRSGVLILNGNDQARGGKRASIVKALRAVARSHGWRRAVRHGIRLALEAILSRLGVRIGYRSRVDGVVQAINDGQFGSKRALIVDLPRERLVQAFLNADAFVFASWIEYSPLVLFEACAAGLPFLTSPAGNAAEIAAWTGGGEVCDAAADAQGYVRVDPDDLARRLGEFLSDSGKLGRYRAAGLAASRARFNWNALAREYETVFARVAAARAARRQAAS